MKYLLPILCLFIFSCDSGGDSKNSSLEDFIMPTTINNSWTYKFESLLHIDDTPITNVVYVTREVINESSIDFDYESDCINENLVYFFTYIDSSYLELFSPEQTWNNNQLIEGLNVGIKLETQYFSSYIDNEDDFTFCNFIDTLHTNDGNIDEMTSRDLYFNTLLDQINLDYPLYIGKTWIDNSMMDSPDPVYYEVISEEYVTVNIENTPTTFRCYKVNLNLSALANDLEINYYISELGIVKIEAHLGTQTAQGPEEEDQPVYEISTSLNYELFNYHLPYSN